MKVAIHHRDGSFSKAWINYCKMNNIEYVKVNAYSPDIIEQLKDIEVFLWHHQQSDYRDLLFAKQLLFSLECAGVKVYPDFRTGWHFDDKIGQKYLLEAIDAPIISSYVFYDKQDALEWSKTIKYPVVFKLRGGAGGSNVKLIKSYRQNKAEIRRSFGRGQYSFNAYTRLKDNISLFKQKKVGLRQLAKSLVRVIVPNPLTKFIHREVGYVYYQEFLPDNKFDIRLIVIGGKRAYGMKRLVRDGDFRASGSKSFLYDSIDDRVIKLAFKVAKQLSLQSVAFDFIYDNNKNPKIVEISYGFGTEGSSRCKGYWDDNLEWHEGSFDPFGWILDDIINQK